ncbi:transcription elongation factor 1 homolog [Hevea brasiliensis]|uniref:transcription elongation factor 1 homolog n=1 Tax=Hevea brasiliensis TaxID=3981 RepID=UPI0025D41B72|nr:transcription elongation factor 1 homolog [Hevea brasiliensis]
MIKLVEIGGLIYKPPPSQNPNPVRICTEKAICIYAQMLDHYQSSLFPDSIESLAIAMARRRSKRVVKKPVRVEKLNTVFTCPFCNHPNAVECIIDRKLFVGEAGCRACKASFSTSTTPLTEPIDIYNEWIDECVRVNKS